MIDASEQPFTIVGCYKTFPVADPEGAQQLRTEASQLEFEVQDREIAMRKKSTEALRRQIERLKLEKRRLAGMVADKRPYAIALHKPKLFEISSVMSGESIEKFGATWTTLQIEFEAMMGDTFDSTKDIPVFERLMREES